MHGALVFEGPDGLGMVVKFEAKVTTAFNHLSTALRNVSAKLPYGKLNLNPVLQNRIIGSEGVTNTDTGVNAPSMQTQLTTLFAEGQTNQAAGAARASPPVAAPRPRKRLATLVPAWPSAAPPTMAASRGISPLPPPGARTRRAARSFISPPCRRRL